MANKTFFQDGLTDSREFLRKHLFDRFPFSKHLEQAYDSSRDRVSNQNNSYLRARATRRSVLAALGTFAAINLAPIAWAQDEPDGEVANLAAAPVTSPDTAAEIPPLPEAPKLQPLEISNWRIFDKAGNVTGKWFTSAVGAKPTDLPSFGFDVSGPFYQGYKTELGKPLSQAEGDTQLFENGAIKLNPDGSTTIIKDTSSIKLSEQSRQLKAPPDTPVEILQNPDVFGKTFTFGNGRLRLTMGADTGILPVDTTAFNMMTDAIANPKSQIRSYTIIYTGGSVNHIMVPDKNPYDAAGNPLNHERTDWSSSPVIDQLTKSFDPATVYGNPYYNSGEAGTVGDFLGGVTPGKDAYYLLDIYDPMRVDKDNSGPYLGQITNSIEFGNKDVPSMGHVIAEWLQPTTLYLFHSSGYLEFEGKPRTGQQNPTNN